ncbi:MAG: U32 family peptidase [Sphaerochaetaceae bacterium]|nr:U32 family peptidase [Sphaerochaetaceae bacterium]
MKKIELLSPAGGIEKLETAFAYGADAVYMGLKNFSLRTNAQNFGYDQAEKIREIKSRYNGKLYCTCNIYFHEDDILKLKAELSDMKNYPFDAFIVSDIGVFDTIKNAFPDAEMHLSTQASCINSKSAAMYQKMGFDRIILGRETPLSDIRRIKDANPDLGIEAFVHGAMCMAVSGRCFLSSHLAGRSANQGDCAHTCRWSYRLALEEESRPGRYYPISEDNGFTTIMSSKDLCMIDHLEDLKNAGVDSLKIEGRMKSTYYVASVTRAYRKALDHLYDSSVEYKSYRDELFNVSHREFSTGFFYGKGPVDTDDDINKPAENGYLRDYLFLGTVKEEVKPGIWALDIKNQIKNGDKIEFIGPDVLSIAEDSIKVLDGDFNETDHIDHCRDGYLKTDLPLKEGYLIRREIPLINSI